MTHLITESTQPPTKDGTVLTIDSLFQVVGTLGIDSLERTEKGGWYGWKNSGVVGTDSCTLFLKFPLPNAASLIRMVNQPFKCIQMTSPTTNHLASPPPKPSYFNPIILILFIPFCTSFPASSATPSNRLGSINPVRVNINRSRQIYSLIFPPTYLGVYC